MSMLESMHFLVVLFVRALLVLVPVYTRTDT
jgi:hypothetical protein